MVNRNATVLRYMLIVCVVVIPSSAVQHFLSFLCNNIKALKNLSSLFPVPVSVVGCIYVRVV
jgi:hypothetical protein